MSPNKEISRLLERRDLITQNITRDDIAELNKIRDRLKELGHVEYNKAPRSEQEAITRKQNTEIVKLVLKDRHHSITKHGHYNGGTVLRIEPYAHAYMVTTTVGEFVIDEPGWSPMYQFEFRK